MRFSYARQAALFMPAAVSALTAFYAALWVGFACSLWVIVLVLAEAHRG